MISIGLDVGYSSTKAVHESGKFKVPSIVGTFENFFAVNSDREIVTIDGENFLVGQEAVNQSQIVERREDRKWIRSDVYRRLMEYALTKCVQDASKNGNVVLVSGLPLAYFDQDADTLKALILGEHRCKINNVESVFEVKEARIIPQPFGTLLNYALTDEGGIIPERAIGRLGVIDIGGKTTNILSVGDLKEYSREATSKNIGGWTAVRKLTDYLVTEYPDIDDRASNVERILVDKHFTYFGEEIDVSEAVDAVSSSIASQIEAEISQRWGSAAQFEKILITGGGSYLIGKAIEEILPQAFLVGDPVFANAKGFYKFAKRNS
jgi:plasmid segregation protein ParM